LFAWNRVASLVISEDVAWVSTDRAASWLVPFAESFLTIINWWLGSLNWSPLAFSLEVVASIFVIDVHASISRANSGLVNRDAVIFIINWWLGWVRSRWLAESFVPHAVWCSSWVASILLLFNTLKEVSSILFKSDWSAEITWWNFFTGGPDAILRLLTSFLVVKIHASWKKFFPAFSSWWMAEVSSKEISS
jgi:hypothetical protein